MFALFWLFNRFPLFAGKTVLSGSANLFIPHLHGLSASRTINDTIEQVIKGAGVAIHNGWSAVNDFLHLLPFFRGDDCFMAILDNFPVLTRDNVISVGLNPFLMLIKTFQQGIHIQLCMIITAALRKIFVISNLHLYIEPSFCSILNS